MVCVKGNGIRWWPFVNGSRQYSKVKESRQVKVAFDSQTLTQTKV